MGVDRLPFLWEGGTLDKMPPFTLFFYSLFAFSRLNCDMTNSERPC